MKKWLDKYDPKKAQNGIEGTMGGLTNKGFNYNSAWGGQFQDGGMMKAQFGLLTPLNTNLGINVVNKIIDLFSSGESKPEKSVPSLLPEPLSSSPSSRKTNKRSVNIKDPRKVRKTTGKPINPNVDLVSGEYDFYKMEDILKDAKKRGLSKEDAWNLAAIGFQESGWGKTDNNIGHVLDESAIGPSIHSLVNAYTNKMKLADNLKFVDPELRLQVYNGLGFVKPETEQRYHKFKMKKVYGVPVPKEGLNMKKNPLYGKQVIDLRDNVLKKNPEVVNYIESLYGTKDVPKKAMGGSIPGSVGFTYARTKGIPSNGPYAKKTKASAQDGITYPQLEEMEAIDKFAKEYTNSKNFKRLSKLQGDKPWQTRMRRKIVNMFDPSEDISFAPEGFSYVTGGNRPGQEKMVLSSDMGDWPSYADINAHEYGHLGYNADELQIPDKALGRVEGANKSYQYNIATGEMDEGIEHDIAPQENRADLFQLRYQLDKHGIFDSRKKGKFTQEDLDKFKKTGDWNRIQRLYDDEDIIWMMNNVAKSDTNKQLSTAQNGMTYYQHGLDWKPRTISENGGWLSKYKKGGVVKDDMGYWNPDNWGEVVEIDSPIITMEGVYEPLIGVSDTGDVQYMEPGGEYEFDGSKVTEYPVMQRGGRAPIYTSDRNDPRLRAYQDSLTDYNRGKQMWEKYGPEYFNAGRGAYPSNYDQLGPFANRSLRLNPYYVNYVGGPRAIGVIDSDDKDIPVYKKPVQPVVYREAPKFERMLGEAKAPELDIIERQGEFQGSTDIARLPYRVEYREPSGKQTSAYFPDEASSKEFWQSTPGEKTGYYDRKKNGDTLSKYQPGGSKKKYAWQEGIKQTPAVSESSRVDTTTRGKTQAEQNKIAINAWREKNRKYGSDTLNDIDVLKRINMEDSSRKKSQEMKIKGVTDKEVERRKNKQSTAPSWFQGKKLEGRAKETARQEKEDWETSMNEQNRAKEALNKDGEFVFPDGTKKRYSDMDKSEKAYVYSKGAIRPSLSLSDSKDYNSAANIIEDFNPFSTASGWVGNFAEAPEMTEESGSYLPWVAAVADPALTVAPYLIGQPELNVGKVLTKKIFNPIKPITDVTKFMTAYNEGEVGNYIGKKVSEKIKKKISENVNENIKDQAVSFAQNKNLEQPAAPVQKFGGSTGWLNKYK